MVSGSIQECIDTQPWWALYRNELSCHFGVNTAQKVMAGKGYARSMRTHKLKLSLEGDHEEESMSLSYCWHTMTKWDVHLYL